MLYREAKARFDEDEDFKTRARAAVTQLQAGEEAHVAAWKRICEASRREFDAIYKRLGVEITERGESFYNPLLAPLVQELLDRGIAEDSDGAKALPLLLLIGTAVAAFPWLPPVARIARILLSRIHNDSGVLEALHAITCLRIIVHEDSCVPVRAGFCIAPLQTGWSVCRPSALDSVFHSSKSGGPPELLL